MKNFIVAAMTAMLSLPIVAQNSEINRLLMHQKDGSVKVFAIEDVDSITFDNVTEKAVGLEVTAITGSSATIECTMPEGVSKYYVAVVPVDGMVTNIKTFVVENKQAEMAESGSVTLTGLKGGTKYQAAALAFDKYGIATIVSTVELTTKAAEAFTIEIDDVTWGDANVTITPTDTTMKYYYYCMPMSKVNTLDGGIDGIVKFDYDFWQMQADTYYMNLNEVIQEALISGAKTFRTSEESGMAMWGSESVVYCYGIDSVGNAVTPLCYKTFTTTLPIASSNEFDITINKIHPNSVEASITATNDDTYFIAVQRKKFVDYYASQPEAMAYALLSNNYNNPDAFANGNHNIAAEDFSLFTNQDYYIIVFGFNNGLSTSVKTIPFHTLRSSSSAITAFESYFYDENGNITAAKVADNTYTYEVESGTEPCTIFNDLTSVVTEASENYSYSYDSNDDACKLNITGSTIANQNGVYATMEVAIPTHPEVTTILFVSKSTLPTTE